MIDSELRNIPNESTVPLMPATPAPDLTGLKFTDMIGTNFEVRGNRRWIEPTSKRETGFYVWDVFNDCIVPGGAIVSISENVLLLEAAEVAR